MSAVAILLNGPPRSGKDTALLAIQQGCPDVALRSFKFTECVKSTSHRHRGLDVAYDHFEELKDTPLKEFGGLTPRQDYIATSRALKDCFGEDIVIRMTIDLVAQADEELLIFPDVGDELEGAAIVELLGEENCRLIRIHKDGHDFGNCCRTYFSLDGVRTLDIENIEGLEGDFRQKIATYVRSEYEKWRSPISEVREPVAHEPAARLASL